MDQHSSSFSRYYDSKVENPFVDKADYHNGFQKRQTQIQSQMNEIQKVYSNHLNYTLHQEEQKRERDSLWDKYARERDVKVSLTQDEQAMFRRNKLKKAFEDNKQLQVKRSQELMVKCVQDKV